MIRHWLKNSNNISRSGYLWNTAAASVTAGQSALIMIFITRALGTEQAGIFGIAYAYALLLSTFSKYGIRNYQVTDMEEIHLRRIYCRQNNHYPCGARPDKRLFNHTAL